jgi:tetratricopeptide (TPR) repeat protein
MANVFQSVPGVLGNAGSVRSSHVDSRLGEIMKMADELKKQIKEGLFDETEWQGKREVPTLTARAKRLADQLRSLRSAPDADALLCEDGGGRRIYLWALSWAADALEYCGDFKTLRLLIEEEGRALSGELLSMPMVPIAQREIARQKVWLVLHYAHAWFYRDFDYREALRYIDLCDKFIKIRLKDDHAFPCFYTRARVAAYRAAVLRQLSDWNGARRFYEESLDFIHKRLARELDESKNSPARISQENTRASYEVAKILALGIGYCQKAQGLLHEAHVNVKTALVMLSPVRDVLRKAYAQLLLGSIERAEAGFDVRKLSEVIESLAAPRSAFLRYHHQRYVSRADFELALAYLYRARALQASGAAVDAEKDYAEAEVHIKRVLKFSEKAGDWRWEALSLVVRSRVARGRTAHLPDAQRESDIKAARADAQGALKRARDLDQDTLLRIDAELAAGETMMAFAHASPADLNVARLHFEEALSRAKNNPKLIGVVHLHLADVYLRKGDLRKALGQFDQWELVRESADHGVVREMAREVRRRIDEAKESWFIASARESLNHKHHDRKLREFLFNQASAHDEDVETIAKKLGIKRATYYKWQKEFRQETRVDLPRGKGSGK